MTFFKFDPAKPLVEPRNLCLCEVVEKIPATAATKGFFTATGATFTCDAFFATYFEVYA